MASLMEELLDVLQQEEEQYTKLVELSEAKTDALVSAKVKDIQEIAEAEQAIVEVIQRCEKKCDEVIKDMGIVLGRDMDAVTVVELIDMLEKQPEEQAKLKKAYEELREVAVKMKACNERNRILVEQALELVEFDLTLFRSLRMAPETANYSKDAMTTDAAKNTGRGRFDTKQ